MLGQMLKRLTITGAAVCAAAGMAPAHAQVPLPPNPPPRLPPLEADFVPPNKHVPPEPDGDAAVGGDAFAALTMIRQRNKLSLELVDVTDLAAAIRNDGQIDAGEIDLLGELTNSQFRKITVVPQGASGPKLDVYPVSGANKQVLKDVLDPPLDLAAALARGAEGWREIVTEARRDPARQEQVTAFLVAQLESEWQASNLANAFKPVRDRLMALYRFTITPPTDELTTKAGQALLWHAAKTLDLGADDKLPDFLYNWMLAGG
jgi:hypothetical protein